MDRRAVIACAAVALSVLGLATASAAAAKPVAPPTAAKPVPKPTPGHSAAPKQWLGHHSAQAVRTARRPAPAPHVPRLDPQLQTGPAGVDGTVEVDVRGDARSVSAAIAKVGGRTVAVARTARTAVVPRSALSTLAGAPGVAAVDQPVHAFTDSISEGAAASNAQVWQAAGHDGTGAAIGIVDGGFANLSSEITAGNLPAALVHYVDNQSDPANQNHCQDENNSDHGTAVAEIIHQMAPGADLYLYCIDDRNGFAQAEQQIQSAGNIKIVNSSLGFPGDSRGDGTGDPGSTATTVKTARQAGILWIQSAGNNGFDHWTGTLRDADHDGLVDLNGTQCTDTVCNEWDGMFLEPGGSATVVLKWDDWPTVPSAIPLTLYAVGWQCDEGCATETEIGSVADSQQAGQPPVLHVDVTNNTALYQEWDVYLGIDPGVPAVSYDLSYWGSVGDNHLSEVNPGRAAADSVTEPADSPYALAVGAVDAQPAKAGCDLPAETTSTYPLETFSSQGPTIDGRVKPDIAGFDNVTGNLGDLDPFCGTSAAAPHVAGAAALVAAANPGMDAAQIQDFLERRAGTSPPNNQTGHGVLNLGPATGIEPPAGSGYTALPTPQRVLDTRNGVGGHLGALGAKQAVTVTVPGLPNDATAVAVNLAGTGVRQSTFLAAYPGGAAWPGTANLNLSAIDNTAAAFAVVTLGPGHTINVRNDVGSVHAIVDLVGYFASSATGKYSPITAVRIVDTRNGTGGYTGTLANHQTQRFTLPAGSGVPADATSMIVNVTATGQPAAGYVTLSTDCSGATSTLNYLRGFTRGNLSIAALDGSSGFCVFNSGGPANVVIDLVGYVGPSGSASYVALPAPVRISDTRTGNGGHLGALGARGAEALQSGGIFDVPYSAKAVMTNVTATAGTAGTFLTAYPGQTRPFVATLSVTSGRTVPNAAVVNLTTSGGATIYNDQGSVQVIVDAFGYFV